LEWEFLVYLRDVGRNTAAAWLDKHYGKIGNESSVDLRSLFQ
jgi:NTE family protein